MSLNIGIIGATGIIGKALIKELFQRNQISISLFSSQSVYSKKFSINGSEIDIHPICEGIFSKLDVVIFSTNIAVSQHWIPIAIKHSAHIIDLSDAYRLHPNVPLASPSIDKDFIKNSQIIACPNCTVCLLSHVLHPLDQSFGLLGFSVSTYQSVSGAGNRAVSEWENQLSDPHYPNTIFTKHIANNLIPLIGAVHTNNFSDEELSIIRETKKIFKNQNLKISATCVRVSVKQSHGMSLTFRLKEKPSIQEIEQRLRSSSTIKFELKTPTETENSEIIYVSRIREDDFIENGFSLWITADQINAGTVPNILNIIDTILKK